MSSECECDTVRTVAPGVLLGMSAVPRACHCPNFAIYRLSVKLTNQTGWCASYPSIIPIIIFHPFLCDCEGHNHSIPGYPGDVIDIWYLESLSDGWVFSWGSLQFDNQPWAFIGLNGWHDVSSAFGYGPTTSNDRGCHPAIAPGPLGHVDSDAGGSCDLEFTIP